jgi:pimeloyl-ACP methyl ester carboxylesterase
VTDLHVSTWGETGPRVLLVHGSMGWSEETFAMQQPLAERLRLELLDRRGMGQTPADGRVDFERDGEDIAAALGDGAHLVAHSYGALGAMLAAARRPDAVRSLLVIEPPAFALARGAPAVEELLERLAAVYPAPPETDPDRFYADFCEAFGLERPDPGMLLPEDVHSIRASMTERAPWEAEVPLDELTAGGFPILVASGTWDDTPPEAQRLGGAAMDAICAELAEQTGAERVIFPGAGHNPQLSVSEAFNERLAAWIATSTAEH